MRSVSYRALVATAAAGLLAVSVAAAQGLPAFAPLNPMAASRSGVYFQPYRPPSPGKWTAAVSLDYGSAIERSFFSAADYTLDAEILRLDVTLGHDLGPRAFVMAEAGAGGAYAGFMDGFLNWYHRTFGFRVEQRDLRPTDQFLYEVVLPDGSSRFARAERPVSRRSAIGCRLPVRPLAPVGTLDHAADVHGADGLWARGGISQPAQHGAGSTRTAPGARGWPRPGLHALSRRSRVVQHETFVSANGGARYRFWGRQSLYANVFYHSPYYHDTDLPALDRRELSLDFGWLLATHGGADWRIGMTEDLEPGGPGIDLIFRLGRDF